MLLLTFSRLRLLLHFSVTVYCTYSVEKSGGHTQHCMTGTCTQTLQAGHTAMLLQGVLRKSRLLKSQSQRFTILDTMNTVLQPGRFTLLLGPPGAGKSTLLKALAGRFHKSTSVDVSLSEAV